MLERDGCNLYLSTGFDFDYEDYIDDMKKPLS